jgi:hypothetical protein
MLLCDQPPGTTADLTDFAVAYWNGRELVGAYLRDKGKLDEDFPVDENAFEQWRDDLVDWVAHPKFTRRPELLAWLARSPQRSAG